MFSRSICARQNLTLRRPCNPIPPCALQRPFGLTRSILTTQQDLRLRPWKPKTLHAPAGDERNLATAWGDYPPTDDVLLDGISPMLRSSQPSATLGLPPYELRSFTSPLIVEDCHVEHPRQRLNHHGIPGDFEEMLAIFHALVDVGKLDRAFLVLQRFQRMNLPRSDLVGLHNRYLQKRVAQIHADPGMDRAEDLHRWYELEIKQTNIPATSETIAYMLKASLLTSHGERLGRLVRRYMEALPQQEGFQDFYTGDVLTDQDLAVIANLCQDHEFEVFHEPEDAMAEEPIQADAIESSTGSMEEHQEPTSSVPSARTSPAVDSTPQKGMGLKTLKKTLALFQTDIPEGHDISKLSYEERRDIQARLEKDSITSAMDRWREEKEIMVKLGHQPILASISRSTLGLRISDWQAALEKRLKEELRLLEASEAAVLKNAEDLERCLYGPFIRLAEPSRLSGVVIIILLNGFAIAGAERGVSVAQVVNQVGKVAELDIKIAAREKKNPSRKKIKKKANTSIRVAMRKLRAELQADKEQAAVHDQRSLQEAATLGTAVEEEKEWPVGLRTKLGSFLVSAILETAMVTCMKEHPDTGQEVKLTLPAFHHTFALKKGKKIGVIRANRILTEILKREPRSDFLARHLPMVVEPTPWTKFDKGGFLESTSNLVRIRSGAKDQQIYTEAAVERGHMDQVLKGLDVLGRTAWNINRPVFDVMLQVWNSGEGLANIPALEPDLEVAKQPSAGDDPSMRAAWSRKVRAIMNEIAGHHSVRCFMNFQLEVARSYLHQTFYFPHNVDFRGRAYPIPPYLNHMGADHVRGLLRFAVGKELGDKGLRWLKIHLANVFGYDKASLGDREAFAMQNLDNIVDSVTNPLDGKRWWLEAEDPWQCLATCHELKAALESPEPTKYVSHLPVHQDGTCNGLQHYAALGGDSWGARQVNLEPADRPADVYTAVADLVQASITKDLEQGDPLAKALDGKITRKVVKQTVMTNVYGVTFSGAKKQIMKQLRNLYPDLEAETGISLFLLSAYVGGLVFKALSKMFSGANDIQRWLGETGGRICRSFSPDQVETFVSRPAPAVEKARVSKPNSRDEIHTMQESFRTTIIWTTPLRMPVVQPYRKTKSRVITTCLQEIQLCVADKFDPVNRRKQLQAFPPNFIHSLDASHMLLTALECDERGLCFAAVHDSFWTHASDVDTMNDVIRNAFIRIHQEDVIGRLRAEFEARYKNFVYLARVDASSEVAKKIKAHRTTSKLMPTQELVMEKKRMELLNSSNPDEVEEGRNMVTPATIFEADSAAADDLIEAEELSGVAMEGTTEVLSEDAAEDMQFADPASEAVVHGGPDELNHADDVGEADPVEADGMRTQQSWTTRLQSRFALAVSVKKPTARQKIPVEFWAPFALPPLPKKGEFDVNRLRKSAYFFS